MKITLTREALLKSQNQTILDFVRKHSRNQIFRFDSETLSPEDFGLRNPGEFRAERVSDKGYLSLPFSLYHTPLYSVSDIKKLFPNTDLSIPDRTAVSPILPLNTIMENVTPEQLGILFENMQQKQSDLDKKLQLHAQTQAELEMQEQGLQNREKAMEQQKKQLDAEIVKLDLERAEHVASKVGLEKREKELENRIDKHEREEKAAKIYAEKLQKDFDNLLNLQKNTQNQKPESESANLANNSKPVESVNADESLDQIKTQMGMSVSVDDNKNATEMNTKQTSGTVITGQVQSLNQPGQTRPVQSTSNPDLDNRTGGFSPSEMAKIDDLIKKYYDKKSQGQNISTESSVRPDLQRNDDSYDPILRSNRIMNHSERIMTHGNESHSDFSSPSFQEKIPVPLISDETIKDIDGFIEALGALKVYFKSEASLILSILVKSKKLQIIPLLSKLERENVDHFSKFLRGYYNTSDYFSLRSKYESLKQGDSENIGVYLRKVMRLYFLSKSIEPPSDLSEVKNVANQKDIQYKFLKSLRNQKLSNELTIRDPTWIELPVIAAKLDDIYKRLENESVSVNQVVEEEVNKISDGCYNCGSRSHIARDCRASRKDKRSFNRKERRRSFSRGRSPNRREYRNSPFPSRNASFQRSNSRDNYKKYRSRSHSGYRLSRSPSRHRPRSQSSPRRYFSKSSTERSSPYDNKSRSNSYDKYRKKSESPKRYDRKVKFL